MIHVIYHIYRPGRRTVEIKDLSLDMFIRDARRLDPKTSEQVHLYRLVAGKIKFMYAIEEKNGTLHKFRIQKEEDDRPIWEK